MAIPDSMRWRVIRAILGWPPIKMARELGVHPNTVGNWEHGRSIPNGGSRDKLSAICQEHRIAIRGDGFPVPE
jgi:DNA-binding transcriptional regulator YiaG